MLTKDLLRKSVKERLSALSAEDRAQRDQRIATRFLSTEEYSAAKSIFLYNSTAREAGTQIITERALADGKAVYFPRVEGENMVLVPYRAGEPLSVGAFGIREPPGEAVQITPDLAVIPLVAFDRTKARLGKGKGYYDRFLASYGGTSIALAYAEQETEKVPTESFDAAPQIVVTDKEIIR